MTTVLRLELAVIDGEALLSENVGFILVLALAFTLGMATDGTTTYVAVEFGVATSTVISGVSSSPLASGRSSIAEGKADGETSDEGPTDGIDCEGEINCVGVGLCKGVVDGAWLAFVFGESDDGELDVVILGVILSFTAGEFIGALLIVALALEDCTAVGTALVSIFGDALAVLLGVVVPATVGITLELSLPSSNSFSSP